MPAKHHISSATTATSDEPTNRTGPASTFLPVMAAPTGQSGSQQPAEAQTTSTAASADQGELPAASRRKRTHRGGKKKRNRRQSFAAPSDDTNTTAPTRSNRDLLDVPSSSTARPPFYTLGQSGGRNLSSTSLDSEALLDHRYGCCDLATPIMTMESLLILGLSKGPSANACSSGKSSNPKCVWCSTKPIDEQQHFYTSSDLHKSFCFQ